MALNAPRGWLVCYDIGDPRRLSRFHRFLKQHAVPVQYSVFCFQGSAAQLGRLVRQIESRIDAAVDDVRVYQLPEHPQYEGFGRGSLPEGVTIRSADNAALPYLTRSRS